LAEFFIQLSFLDISILYWRLYPTFFKQPHFFFLDLVGQLDTFSPPCNSLRVIILKVVLEETILPLVEGTDQFVIRMVLLWLVLLVMDLALFFMKESLFVVIVEKS